MTDLNAIIQECSILRSEYEGYVVIEMKLKLQGGNCVDFSVYCNVQESGNNQLGCAISKILNIAGTYSFDKVEGKPIRARFKDRGTNGDIIVGIGHFLNDEWFIPREEKLWKEKENE